MKQRGKSEIGFPRLMLFSYPVGRVYFTIYFTVRVGVGDTPQIVFDGTQAGVPSLSIQTRFLLPLLGGAPLLHGGTGTIPLTRRVLAVPWWQVC
jgi:hypothetical protein